MNVARTIAATALITALTLITACTDADAPDTLITSDQGNKVTPEAHDPMIDFYRAEGLPELYGSLCEGKDRPVIGIQYTHSIIKGEAWRGSSDATEEFVMGRGKYGENLRHESGYGDDENRLYAYDYYVRGQPGELVIIGRPGSASGDGCMIGVLTDETLRP